MNLAKQKLNASLKMTKLLALIAAFAATLATSQAATITWGTPTSLSSFVSPDPTAVNTVGTLFAAKKFGGTTDYTVNGVTFAGAETHISLTTGSFYGTYGTPAGTFATMLSTFNPVLNGPGTMTLSGLTTSQSYSVQIFAPIFDTTLNTTLTAGTSVSLANGNITGPVIPQYVIGTFTADAATQTIALTTSSSWGVSAAQVRAVPEPATWALLAFSLTTVMVLRRRRNS